MNINHAIAFATALALGFFLVPGVLIIASHLKILSPIDFRRKNNTRVPLLGGLAIYLAVLFTSMLFPESEALSVCLYGLPLIIVGVIDDWSELGAKPKFLAQILAVTLFLYFREPNSLILEQVGLSPVAATILTGFWIIGMTNAFNFIDGMDGVAGGVATISAFTLAFMSQYNDYAVFGMLISGASLSFLFFNLPKAKIYLGDAGSTFIGFALAVLAAQIPMRHVHFLWITAPMFVVAFPQIDALLAMYRRAKIGISLFKGDHDHIHHRLIKIGFNAPQALVVIYGVNIYCSIAAMCLFYTSNNKFALALLFLTISALTAVLAGISFIQYRLAQQVSSFSRSLIHKYFSVHEEPEFDDENFTAIVFDLLPYYKELQQRGILIVDRFISSFSRVIERRCPHGQIKTIGSYSIVLVYTEDNLDRKLRTEEKLIEDYHCLLESFSILRNISKVPEGVKVYSESMNKAEFLQIIKDNDKKLKVAA